MMKKNLFTDYVVVDGSGYDIFSTAEIKNFRDSGLNFEQLSFVQNGEDIETFGKSYGECTLIDYAISNSDLINRSGGFYKLSPRYMFNNAHEVISKITEQNFFFNYNIWPLSIKSPFTCTIFYKTSLDFYKSYLLDSISECSHDEYGFLESVFYRRLAKIREKKRVKIPFPFFSGIAGTTGAPIDNRHYYLRNCISSIGLLAFEYD
jgi:hypothetical protein